MSALTSRRGASRVLLCCAGVGLSGSGCLDHPVAQPATVLQSGVRLPIHDDAVEDVDILFEIDNSNSMRDNQSRLSQQFGVLIDQLVNPPVDPETQRPRYPPVKRLHVGVISSDLGTPGSTVPSCANSDVGDDGLLNPIRNGLALRAHAPWTGFPWPRPARCQNRPDQYPNFLTFEAASTSASDFREDFVCNAFLSTGGCGLEQQLESMYRAVVLRDAHDRPGNTDPNAGFIRDHAVLALVVISDEEDGSTRDCRYAERGQPCTDALTVFDMASGAWSSTDLNLRFYMYRPGSAEDPTWPIDRYAAVHGTSMDPDRGFLLAKPGQPEQVIFAAIAGVPINLPMRAGSTLEVDWGRLLGTRSDGSDGYTGSSTEGPVSMRQANLDPSCPTRVVPACRREGTSYDPVRPACDTTAQYFAWPSRRIAEVARRFSVYNGGNGTVSSICRNDYSTALRQIVDRIQHHFWNGCLPRRLDLETPTCCDGQGRPTGCTLAPSCTLEGARSVRCDVRETLGRATDAATWCTAEHGRRRSGRDANGYETCIVSQVAVVPGMPAGRGTHGFYYDTAPDPSAPSCTQQISFTEGDRPPTGSTAVIECVQSVSSSAPSDAGAR